MLRVVRPHRVIGIEDDVSTGRCLPSSLLGRWAGQDLEPARDCPGAARGAGEGVR